ncbi:hypothetical protein D1007_20686 [Hordeum vulgare]|nr:hypothetical protein D1007_20686 [Hordeum vulgare]
MSRFGCGLQLGEIRVVHLYPNSFLLLAIFTFYCESFVGVKLSVALFHHFFSLRSTAPGQRSACVSFVDVEGAGTHLKAGKKGEGYRSRSIFVDVCRERSFLAIPLSPPEQSPRWNHKKLTDPREGPILERIPSLVKAHLTALGTFTSLVGAHRRRLLDVPTCRRLTHDELDGYLGALLGSFPEDLPRATPLLFACDDMEEMVTEMPVLYEWGLVGPLEGSPIMVSTSSGDISD